ncbi:MAG: hypothetical protein V4532_04810 [Pseudomonadota bacterium]
MNARHWLKSAPTWGVVGVLLLAGAAQARDVQWSVAVNAPVAYPGNVRAVVSNGPGYYYQGPVIVQQPVLVQQSRRFYQVQPVVYEPERRCEPAPRWGWGSGWRRHHHRDDAYAYGDGRGDRRGDDDHGRHHGDRGRWHD